MSSTIRYYIFNEIHDKLGVRFRAEEDSITLECQDKIHRFPVDSEDCVCGKHKLTDHKKNK